MLSMFSRTSADTLYCAHRHRLLREADLHANTWLRPQRSAGRSSIRCSISTQVRLDRDPLADACSAMSRKTAIRSSGSWTPIPMPTIFLPRPISSRRPACGRHRREVSRSTHLEGDLQPAGLPGGRVAMGPPVRRRRAVPHRQLPRRGDLLARSHGGVDHLYCGRRCIHPRHAVHAGRRHGAGRLPGRQCASAMAYHPAHPRTADADTSVYGARLPAK